MLDRRLCAIPALVLVAGVSVLEIRGVGNFSASAQSLAADPKNAKENRPTSPSKEMALAKEALQIARKLEEQARIDSNDVSIWSRRLVEATRKSRATKPEVVQAIKDHLARMDGVSK